MLGLSPPLVRVFSICSIGVLFCYGELPAAPTAIDDSYSVAEDNPLVVTNAPLIDANFDGGGAGGAVAFDGDWDYFDAIENENGAAHPYPVDGSGNAWNSVAFDPSTSTIGAWKSGAMPLQSGGVDGFPGALDLLAGIAAAGNGQNLSTTYLFRNTFTLAAAQVAIANWTANLLVDDGCVIYINGVEVDRFSMPGGAVTTTTFANFFGDETNYVDRALPLGGVLATGSNTIAVEVHQNSLDSSDIGIDLNLRTGSSATGGFVYQDDFFGTDIPQRAAGGVAVGSGFNGTDALNVEVGRGNFFERGSKSGAWLRDFELAVAGSVEVTFRYRQTNSDGFDPGDFAQVILDIDGTRYGDDQDNSVSHLQDGGDTGWQLETRTVALGAGNHTLALGVFNNLSSRNSEVANVWFDDVLVEFSGGAGGVLENDSGAGPVTANLVTTTPNGTLNLAGDGTFSYVPAANFFGTDTFTYEAVDATGTSNEATVTITVDPVNDPPFAAPETYPAIEDEPLAVAAADGLLFNDSDVEGQPLTAALASQASRGIAVVNPDGSFSYTPEGDFFGTDTFTYTASDGSSSSSPATVTIDVSAGDDPPVTSADSYRADENIALVITESGSGEIVFSTNFDAGLPAEIGGAGALESVENFSGLGVTGNQFGGQFFRNPTGVAGNGVQTPTTLTLTNLPPHTSLSIEFLLAVLDTWDGLANNFASDYFVVQVDGATIFRHYLEMDPADQSYVAPPGGLLSTGSDLGVSGEDDSAYDMGLEAAFRDIPHAGPTATITFFAGGNDWDGGNAGESWAMDNLRVTVSNEPRETLLPAGSLWRYLDDGSDQATAWRAPGFDDASWAAGNAKLGYGDGDEATTVSFGPDENNKYATTYFRTAFNVADPAVFSSLLLAVRHDDAAAVYLNGVEVSRTNLVGGADSGEFAQGTMPNEIETNFFTHSVDPALLVVGANVLAVEVHQANGGSSDLGFDLAVAGVRSRSAGGVLSNDIELDGQVLTASLVSNAANGDVSLNPDGTFTYTPGLNFHGTDTFTYAASDGISSTEETVTITVTPGPNDIPETMPDTYGGTEDQNLVVPAANGVLDNDVDPDMDPLTARVHTPAANGTVTLGGDGGFTYVPDADFAGADTFEYIVNDTIDDSVPTLVTLNIANVNDRPVAEDDIFVAQPGQLLSVPAAGVLGNDRDADSGTVLTAIPVSGPASGTLNLAGDGSFTYQPAGGFGGAVMFSYRASDGVLQSSSAADVTVHVNARPAAVADSYAVVEDNSLSVGAPGLLGNDSDPEDDALSAVLVAGPADGTLVLAGDGSFDYTPDDDFAGSDSFTYAANDGLQNSNLVSVSINVSAVNDPPVASDDTYAVLAGTTFSVLAADGVLANDIDVDGPVLSASPQTLPANGTLSGTADGAFSYTPAPDFSGVDSFTYVATDGLLSSDPVTVTLDVGLAAESILISEIMYHPGSENSAEEYIELFNSGDAPIDVGGWQFTSGLTFTLPSIVVPPGEYLVVAADPAAFTNFYGAVPLLVGGWTGGLSNRGERIRLVDSAGNESDDITYSDQGDWAERRSVNDGGELGWEWNAPHDGGGSSLELINPALSNKNGQNWAPSGFVPTPGAANSVASGDTAPLVSNVKHRPAVPKSTDPVTITAKLKDVEGTVLGASLFYRVSTSAPGGFNMVTMFDDGLHGDGDAGDGEFGAILPPDANGTIYEFYVRATDGTNSRTWPAPTNTGQNANALFQFDDEEFTEHYPIYRTIITQPDEDRFPFGNRSSNAQLNTTFIADNCGDISVRYLSSMRIRGASSRNDNPPPTRVGIAADDPWDGETRLNLNTQFTWLQFIGMKFFQASGLPAPDTKRIAMRRNGIDRSEQGEEGYGSIVHVQPLQEEFLDHYIPDDAGGNLYKKVRPDVNWAYRGGNLQRYAGDGWNKQTNASEDDWSDLDEFLRVMNQAPDDPDYIAQVEVVANLDQWLRWFAVMTIINNGETNASNGADDDYSIYRGVADPRFIFIPHDLDTILGQGDGSSITDPESTIFDMIERGDSLGPLVPLFQDAGILTRYYTELRELLQTTFSPGQFEALLDNHLSGWVPQARIDEMISYMDQRRAHITGLVDAQLGPPPPATQATTDGTLGAPHGDLYISEVLAANFTAYDVFGTFPDAIELHNTGSASVSLEGMSLSDDPDQPQRYVFPAGANIGVGERFVINSDTLGFALSAEGDSVILYDSGGALVDSVQFGFQVPDFSISRTGAGAETWALTAATIGSVNASPVVLGNPDLLVINEWLVRPQVTFDREFVEIYNPGSEPVALGGLIVTDEPVGHPRRHSLPPLGFIGADQHVLLYPVGGGSASPDDASELPFRLSADHGWLSISGTNGIEIDEVHYICQRNDIAFGRESDGAAAIIDFDLPTPGFSNSAELGAEATLLSSLRITEIMYHPQDNGELEYLRLKNIGADTINLEGIRMSNGVRFDLPATDLAPGEEAVIVRNQAAYEATYGAAGILGQYDGALSNGGERLRLEIANHGYGILDFDFKDGWYPITDGFGASLGIVDENAPRDTWDERESWRPIGGDTGSYDGWVAANFTSNDPAIIGRDADPDGDGIPNSAEFAMGLDPNSPDRADLLGVQIEGDFLTLTYPRRKGTDAQFVVEAAGDLERWQVGPTEVMLSDDGTIEIWKATDSIPITAGDERYMRVRITVP